MWLFVFASVYFAFVVVFSLKAFLNPAFTTLISLPKKLGALLGLVGVLGLGFVLAFVEVLGVVLGLGFLELTLSRIASATQLGSNGFAIVLSFVLNFVFRLFAKFDLWHLWILWHKALILARILRVLS